MSKKIILSIALCALFLSCETLESSIGEINTITIISSEADRIQSEHILQYFFNNRFIHTPQKEMIYSINWVAPNEINKAKLMKNVLLLSLEYPSDSTIDVLVNRIIEKNNITENISSSTNMFAKDQKVIMIKSTDTIELEAQLATYFSWISSEYNQNIYQGYYDYIVEKDENSNLKSFFEKVFNMEIFIQEDYELIKRGTGSDEDNFVWIGRGYPYRWIMFYKFKKNMIDKEFKPYILFEDVLKFYDAGISIYDNYRKKTPLTYNDVNSYVYRGLYEHQESQTGGPFALYVLDNINNDEVILVASIINNPGNNKMTHLLQMDALIKNIKFLGD